MTDPRPRSERDEQQDKKWYERSLPLFILTFVGIGLGVLVLGLILDWYIAPRNSPERRGLIQALGLITAGVAGAVGIFFTWRGQRQTREAQEENQQNTQAQLNNAQDELTLTRQGQITERFTRAIDQLGNARPEVRIGGIYALESIARESKQHYWPIVEVVTAFVRTRTSQSPEEGPQYVGDAKPVKDRTHLHGSADVQAALYVLANRNHAWDPGGDKFINLSGTDLRNADLRGVHLEKARLRRTNLTKAILRETKFQSAKLTGATLNGAKLDPANFEEADLGSAHLEKADLEGADLRGAKLDKANLSEADLTGANLTEANLSKAILRGAILRNANLSSAEGITNEELEQQATTLEGAIMPDGSEHP
jgi:hypothetical protein